MIEASFGLAGVVLGFSLSFIKEWFTERKKERREIGFLASHLVSKLEQFIEGCASVVGDDGLSHGQPDERGYYRRQVSEPTLSLNELDADWRVLKTELMYKIFMFPNEIEEANKSIDFTFDSIAFPPDFDEGFEERQFRYACLGIKANEIAQELRKFARLPSERPKEDWDSVQYIMEKQHSILERRSKRQAWISSDESWNLKDE